MIKQTWTNHIVPPFVCMVVAGCVWYAFASHPKAMVIVPATSHATAQSENNYANAAPIVDITPTVSRLDGQLQFSVATKPSQQIQKVEFFVENKFVGAAFAQPFSVSMSENDLAAGTHTVTAKVYTTTATAQTTPALFSASPTIPPAANIEESEAPPPPAPPLSIGASQPNPAPTVATPTGLAIIASADGTSAQLGWDVTPGAVSYQIWCDGVQIGTTANAAYNNGGLAPGQTYDYKLIAVNSTGNLSASSPQVAVTMPTQKPIDTPPVNQSQSSGQSQPLGSDSAASVD